MKQRGLTLIELLVSTGLSLLLMIGVATVFQANRTTFNVQEGISSVQENARIAMSKIESDIRNAGYYGCGSVTTNFRNLLNYSTDDQKFFWDFGTPVQGAEAGTDGSLVPALPDSIADSSTAAPASYSDVLTLRFVDRADARVDRHINNSRGAATEKGRMRVTGFKGLEVDDIVVASTCQNAVVFQITAMQNAGTKKWVYFKSGSGTPGNIDSGVLDDNDDSLEVSDPGLSYTGGEIGVMKTRTYYVRDGASGEPALWRVDNGTAQELVEGVENMQVSYGVDTNLDRIVDDYYTAKDIDDNSPGNLAWDRVSTVRVSLVMRSRQDDVLDQADNLRVELSDTDDTNNFVYFPNPASSSDKDKRLRQVFTTTVALRNKVK